MQRKLAVLDHADFCECWVKIHLRVVDWCNGSRSSCCSDFDFEKTIYEYLQGKHNEDADDSYHKGSPLPVSRNLTPWCRESTPHLPERKKKRKLKNENHGCEINVGTLRKRVQGAWCSLRRLPSAEQCPHVPSCERKGRGKMQRGMHNSTAS